MNVRFHALEETPLGQVLDVPKPLREYQKAHLQLEYVDRYVRQPELGAKSIAVEEHYIDRDFIEDYSAFYSRNLTEFPNYCRRVHFFSLDKRAAARKLAALRRITNKDRFRKAAASFSRDYYLGFCVLKPLWGSPVGRTILKCFPQLKEEDGRRREFGGTCSVIVHLMGIPLRVQGLAFQQQDLGVSACATTALWSALHRMRDLEGGAPATPAHITMRASEFALPFGRSMPSEGLDLNQMCQAVQSFGYSPALSRADQFLVTRWILFSAVRSEMSPVVILAQGDTDFHAVSVAGIKTEAVSITPGEGAIVHDMSGDLCALYIHDDRYGPYLRAPIVNRNNAMELEIELLGGQPKEIWRVSHVLIPMHNKVRLSFPQLLTISHWLALQFRAAQEALGLSPVCVRHAAWIERSSSYLEDQIIGKAPARVREQLCTEIRLSRYVGIVRLRLNETEELDVVLDTTSTERNLVCSAVVSRGSLSEDTKRSLEYLAEMTNCPSLC
jgi:hypothetical protein